MRCTWLTSHGDCYQHYNKGRCKYPDNPKLCKEFVLESKVIEEIRMVEENDRERKRIEKQDNKLDSVQHWARVGIASLTDSGAITLSDSQDIYKTIDETVEWIREQLWRLESLEK